MKTIGLIGGVSWVSTAEYYKRINTYISKKFGGLHFALGGNNANHQG